MGGFPEEGYDMLEVMAHSTIDIVDRLDLDYYNSLFSSPGFNDDDNADKLETFMEMESAKALSTVIENSKITWLGVNNFIYDKTAPEEIIPPIMAALEEQYTHLEGTAEDDKRIDYFSLDGTNKYRLDLNFHKNKLVGFALYKPVSE